MSAAERAREEKAARIGALERSGANPDSDSTVSGLRQAVELAVGELLIEQSRADLLLKEKNDLTTALTVERVAHGDTKGDLLRATRELVALRVRVALVEGLIADLDSAWSADSDVSDQVEALIVWANPEPAVGLARTLLPGNNSSVREVGK